MFFDRDEKGRFKKGCANPYKKPMVKTVCPCGKIFYQPDAKYKHKYCSRSCVGKFGHPNRAQYLKGYKQSIETILKRTEAIKKAVKKGCKSPLWKNGFSINKGYVTKYVAGKHKPYHRYLFEKGHNTKIPEGYVIHHIDGVKLNNNLYNLQCMSCKDHVQLHWDIRKDKL